MLVGPRHGGSLRLILATDCLVHSESVIWNQASTTRQEPPGLHQGEAPAAGCVRGMPQALKQWPRWCRGPLGQKTASRGYTLTKGEGRVGYLQFLYFCLVYLVSADCTVVQLDRQHSQI